MATARQSLVSSRSSKKVTDSSFDVKSALKGIVSHSKSWETMDSQARGSLYNLLESIYVTERRISKNRAAIASLKAECRKSPHIAYSAEDDQPFRRNVTGDSAESALLLFSTRIGHVQSSETRSAAVSGRGKLRTNE